MPTKSSDFKPEKRLFTLHVGDSGSGKSGAAASYPGPYYELDCDGRFGGIFNMIRQGIIEGKDVSYDQFSPFGGWAPVSKALDQLNVYKIQSKSNIIKFPYGTIGLGSLGSLSRILLTMARTDPTFGEKRQTIGLLKLQAPGDSRIEKQGIHQILDHLLELPCNVVVTAHLMDRWGRDRSPEATAYSPRVIIGEMLNMNDQLSSSIVARFDDVYKFERRLQGDNLTYHVEFASELCKNSYGIPPGSHDITNKKFYPLLQELILKYSKIFNDVSKEGTEST